ncbi:MAG: hypothetical protein LBB95_00570 [Mycoplasmataceae bacterium]|jgi:hypothetical protein|nr:hypothetical protein [Mycoplasmataceae bacterium]
MAKYTANQQYRKISYIFMVISCVCVGIFLVPLLWLIPMTLATKKSITDNQPHVTLGVCQLFFAGLIPGIFMLVS